jgi:hypothetical protein
MLKIERKTIMGEKKLLVFVGHLRLYSILWERKVSFENNRKNSSSQIFFCHSEKI